MDRYQAKKAYYKGIEFKSNLESRVAQAFDILGIKWQYESVVFRGPDFNPPRYQYTPDFYLPTVGRYVEVCGVYDERHKNNLYALCKELESTSIRPKVSLIQSEGFIEDMYLVFLKGGPVMYSKRVKLHGEEQSIFDAAGMVTYNSKKTSQGWGSL